LDLESLGRIRPRVTRRPVLVLNAGSSTLKASLVDARATEPSSTAIETWARGGRKDEPDAEVTLDRLLGRFGERSSDPSAVGHRVVHGGDAFHAPTALDAATIEAIERLSELAPLHNPLALATIRAARRRLPNVIHAACFDTAFHAGLPEAAVRYPVPDRWRTEWGIRRYGFHGLSVQWSVGRAATLLSRPAGRLRLVVAHLGAGCSITAVDGGRSAWTSMGLTPLEGTMMATRSGSIDPGVLVRLLRDERQVVDELDTALEHRSGLLAVGGSDDMRELLAREASGDARAALALAMFVDRAAAEIAAALTRLPSVDALVFTGGIGENAGQIRTRICDRLRVVGVPGVPPRGVTRDAVISATGRRPAVMRVAAREDVDFARAVERLARR
jgi:acetate kinase